MFRNTSGRTSPETLRIPSPAGGDFAGGSVLFLDALVRGIPVSILDESAKWYVFETEAGAVKKPLDAMYSSTLPIFSLPVESNSSVIFSFMSISLNCELLYIKSEVSKSCMKIAIFI